MVCGSCLIDVCIIVNKNGPDDEVAYVGVVGSRVAVAA